MNNLPISESLILQNAQDPQHLGIRCPLILDS
jgi:hypothetical protein